MSCLFEVVVVPAWYDVLLELTAADGGRLRMGELGERVVLSRTRVSRLVEDLSRSGLVAREANPDDRRSAFAVLTDTGRRRLRDAAPTYLAGIQEHFTRHLTPDEVSAVGDALWRVQDRIADPGQPSRAGRPDPGALCPTTRGCRAECRQGPDRER